MSVIIRSAAQADAGEIAQVHVETWLTTYTNLLPDEVIAAFNFERRQRMWRRLLTDTTSPAFVIIAEEGRKVCGFAHAGPLMNGSDVTGNYGAELFSLYVLREQQGVGIGRRLTSTVATRLFENGYMSMIVWVLKTNPARHFYEALGGTFLGEKLDAHAGTVVQEVAYGWNDIRLLMP